MLPSDLNQNFIIFFWFISLHGIYTNKIFFFEKRLKLIIFFQKEFPFIGFFFRFFEVQLLSPHHKSRIIFLVSSCCLCIYYIHNHSKFLSLVENGALQVGLFDFLFGVYTFRRSPDYLPCFTSSETHQWRKKENFWRSRAVNVFKHFWTF